MGLSRLNKALAGLLCLSNSRKGPLCCGCGGGSTNIAFHCCSGGGQGEVVNDEARAKQEERERRWALKERKLDAREKRRSERRDRRAERRGVRGSGTGTGERTPVDQAGQSISSPSTTTPAIAASSPSADTGAPPPYEATQATTNQVSQTSPHTPTTNDTTNGSAPASTPTRRSKRERKRQQRSEKRAARQRPS